MPLPPDMAARHAAMLAKAAELALELACALQAQALASTDTEARQGLTLGFYRATRSMRQSIALEAKLVRDAERAVRDEAMFEIRTKPPSQRALREAPPCPRSERYDEVIDTVGEILFTESEREEDEAMALFEEAQEKLTARFDDEDFLKHTIAADVERLCREIGVDMPAHLRAGDDDDFDASPPPPGWRGAAAGAQTYRSSA